MNTQLMKNLIKTIEAAPGKSNREKLEACIQRLLCAMSAMANTQGGLSIRMDAPALGFKPIPIGSAKRWERELTTAYTDGAPALSAVSLLARLVYAAMFAVIAAIGAIALFRRRPL